MLGEILVGALVAAVLVYLFYIYLEWCSTYSAAKVLYETNPNLMMANDRDMIATYGKFMLPEYLSDTYKPIRFWILYYQARYFS